MPKMIGFDAKEDHRVGDGGTYDATTTCVSCSGSGKTSKRGKPCTPCRGTGQMMYDVKYPLRGWGWDRDRCKKEISKAGLRVPVKSACFFCPASKKPEIQSLPSDLYQLALVMEDGYRAGKHFRGEDGSVKGLGRNYAWRSVRESDDEKEI